jgi:hypothetical protein
VLLRQQVCGRGLDLGAAEVEVLESVLLGEELGDGRRRDSAAGDDDLAQAAAGAVLLGERLLELLGREVSLAEQQRAERQAGAGLRQGT